MTETLGSFAASPRTSIKQVPTDNHLNLEMWLAYRRGSGAHVEQVDGRSTLFVDGNPYAVVA